MTRCLTARPARASSWTRASFRLIDGTVLDYDVNLVSKGFTFNNPNAKSTCGCGVSLAAGDI